MSFSHVLTGRAVLPIVLSPNSRMVLIWSVVILLYDTGDVLVGGLGEVGVVGEGTKLLLLPHYQEQKWNTANLEHEKRTK